MVEVPSAPSASGSECTASVCGADPSATAIAAARAMKIDLVIGNVIGSNIFNLLLVLGTAGVLGDQAVEPRIPQLDMPVMCVLAVLPLILCIVGRRTIGRVSGVLLLLIYVGWMVFDPYL